MQATFHPARTLACFLGMALAAGALLFAVPAAAAGTRLLVKLEPGVTGAAATKALAGRGAHTLRTIPRIGVQVVSVPVADTRGARARLLRSGLVRFAERDAIAEPQETIPDDPFFPQGTYSIQSGAWGWYQTHTTRAWDLTQGDPSVRIAILDTGLKPQSLDFGGQIVDGYNVLTGTTDTVSGASSHGTYVAGAAGLAADNGSGNAGYCPDCRIMPVQVGTATGATYANMAAGVVWAVDHGARVVNLSWAGTSSSLTLAEAVAYARSKGAVVFAAAGNSNCDCPTYPAATPGVLGVAGVASSGAKAGDSNYGRWVRIAAPEGNMTAWPSINGAPGYGPVGGTSLAAPAAAGIAGLLISADPTLTGGQVEQALTGSASPVGFPLGSGRVDALAAMEAVGLSDPQAPGPPLNTIAPRVLVATNGIAQDNAPLAAAPQPGEVLVRGQGAWVGSAPLSLSSVKWYRCNDDGGGCLQVGTSWKYTVQEADLGHPLELTVGFKNPVGTVTASAPPTAPVGEAAPLPLPEPAPVNVELPAISGVAEEGRGLGASTGAWSNSPTSYSYQWSRCDSVGTGCAAISGATASSFAVSQADVGRTLRVTVTAANPGGSSSATSASTAVAQPAPARTQTLTFSGSLTAKATSKSQTVAVGAGPATARLSFSKCPSLTLTLNDAAGSAVAVQTGTSVLGLDRTLAAGTYAYVVSGSTRCSYTLTVTSAAP